ncbi:MAG: hypothetical protein KIT87_03930, partial [Anaerolineae bacterium]|nr:hypothetical protein [Anaerolineae bacterium]
EQLRLTEARLGQTSLQAGDVLPVGLRWTAEKPVQDDIKVFVHLVGADGLIIGQHDALPGSRPTGGWAAGETRDDNHGVLVPFGTPPGQAQVRVGLYHAATGQRLLLPDGRDHLVLGQVTLVRPANPPPVEVFNLPYRSGEAVGDLTLLGYSFYKRGFDYAPDTPIHPGDEVQVTLVWQAQHDAPRLPSGLTLSLESASVKTDATPGGSYPLTEWRQGDTFRASHILALPPTLAPGRYPLQLGPQPPLRLATLEVVP